MIYFLLAYEYLGRCPRLVWVGPLALKSDHIQYHHSGIRHEPRFYALGRGFTARKTSQSNHSANPLNGFVGPFPVKSFVPSDSSTLTE